MNAPRSASRTVMTADEDELAVEENPTLKKLRAAMSRRVPSEEDQKLLLALGRALRQLREERGMTPAELACASGVRREELERSKPDDPTPAIGGLGIELWSIRESARRRPDAGRRHKWAGRAGARDVYPTRPRRDRLTAHQGRAARLRPLTT
jgi:transcriptional regulator with XRE-family HTH domain